ncbi:hypothetical protein BB559_005813 [Furculomyces boomerangus]|uniref:Pyrroline-5-carboxylate reductase catalytic N-terminal domain-containing protein n=1 Tax=Furculomyces boomerangus TaxID=61424 RepID=A0A2T9Y6F6_9FUNG|nr:hypothetical protein BB559_005813 [Furculomyces boomerangus]
MSKRNNDIGFKLPSITEKPENINPQGYSHNRENITGTYERNNGGGTSISAEKIGDVGIIGSGWFGSELGYRLTLAGFKVNYGTRNIATKGSFCKGFGGGGIPSLPLNSHPLSSGLLSIEDAILLTKSKIVILAIPQIEYQKFCYKYYKMLSGYTVVDVSNPALRFNLARIKQKFGNRSNAEITQSLLPESFVVKAFNNLNALYLSKISSNSCFSTPISSNYFGPSQKVAFLAREMGITPIYYGLLASSKEIESLQTSFFDEWLGPIFVFAYFFMMWIFLAVLRENLLSKNSNWDLLPIKTFSIAFASTGITLISLSFLPGMLVAFRVLYKNSVSINEPLWLANWLESRRVFGLLSFFSIFMHFITSIISIAQVKTGNQPSIATNTGYLLGYPHSTQLNKKESHFIMSTLGWLTLVISIIHGILATSNEWKTGDTENSVSGFLPISIISMFLPLFTIALKLILLFPPVRFYLSRIQMGSSGVSTNKNYKKAIGHAYYPPSYRAGYFKHQHQLYNPVNQPYYNFTGHPIPNKGQENNFGGTYTNTNNNWNGSNNMNTNRQVNGHSNQNPYPVNNGYIQQLQPGNRNRGYENENMPR